jgi:hypothetical protein
MAARDECVAALTRQLERSPETEPTLNGFVISYLLELEAVESAPQIERAFAADRVDLTVAGDWEDVQVRLGLKRTRESPRPRLFDPGLLMGARAQTSGRKKRKKRK